MKWLDRLERKLGRFAISNLMLIIVIGMAVAYLANMFFPDYNIVDNMVLYPHMVLQGQVWRLLTFLLLPPSDSPVFVIFSLYFYYFIGRELEYSWGSFKFGVFYFIGAIGSIIAAFITGVGYNAYLNLSLFFAFAILFPNIEFMLFFIIPVKAKILAVIDLIVNIVMFIIGDWAVRAAILVSFINILVFFGKDMWLGLKDWWSFRKTRRNFRRRNSGTRYGNRYNDR